VPDERTLEVAESAARRVRNRETTIRQGFIRLARDLDHEEDQRPPLAMLLRGSRGAMRLKLYLAVLWLAGGGETKKGHEVTFPARAYAELLGLDDPGGKGQRRVREGLASFAEARLLTLRASPGYPQTVALLREDASGETYDRPGDHFKKGADGEPAEPAAASKTSVHQFVRLGSGFWTQGWAQVLSAPALAVFLAMLVVTRNGRERDQWLSLGERRLFGLSDDTWTRGTAELVDYGILAVRRAPVSKDVFGWKRMRNTYSLNPGLLNSQPEAEPSDDAEVPPPPAKKRRRTRTAASARPPKQSGSRSRAKQAPRPPARS
jgi:hypothetical protein